jgi:hypothetical protein
MLMSFPQAIASITSAIYRNGGSGNSSRGRVPQGVPKEAHILKLQEMELEDGIKSMIKSIAECFDTRKTTYAAQLRKMREISNMSTRQAIQNERVESTSAMSRLKQQYEEYNERESSDLRQKLDAAKYANELLEAKIQALSEHIGHLEEINANNREDIQREVAAAKAKLAEEYEFEKTRQAKLMMAEHQRIRDEAAVHIEATTTHLKVSLV